MATADMPTVLGNRRELDLRRNREVSHGEGPMSDQPPDLSPLGDEELLTLLKDGRLSEEMFIEELKRRYEADLQFYVQGLTHNPSESEDVARGVWLRVLETIRKDKPRTGRDCLKRLLMVMVLNDVRYRRRQAKTHQQGAATIKAKMMQLQKAMPRPEEEAIRAEEAERLAKCVARLPEALLQVVLLHIYEEETFAEISHKIGVALGTLKSRYQRALQVLKDCLTNHAASQNRNDEVES